MSGNRNKTMSLNPAFAITKLPILRSTSQRAVKRYLDARTKFKSDSVSMTDHNRTVQLTAIRHSNLIDSDLYEEIKDELEKKGLTRDIDPVDLPNHWESLIESHLLSIVDETTALVRDSKAFFESMAKLKLSFMAEAEVDCNMQDLRVKIRKLSQKHGCTIWCVQNKSARKKMADTWFQCLQDVTLRAHLMSELKEEISDIEWSEKITAGMRLRLKPEVLDKYGREAKETPANPEGDSLASDSNTDVVTTTVADDDADDEEGKSKIRDGEEDEEEESDSSSDDSSEDEVVFESRSDDTIVVDAINGKLISAKGSYYASFNQFQNEASPLIKTFIRTHKFDPTPEVTMPKLPKARAITVDPKKTSCCFNCGILGHNVGECDKPRNDAAVKKRHAAWRKQKTAADKKMKKLAASARSSSTKKKKKKK